ncbi:acyl-CoA thioesterase/bile acid-CoA:amino acid N-acyltransferase family protein [Evansella cellulosilytica]|uniref:Alpha/beta fold family hydrolase n=1 Tax=Evansella cellulosilytica (strain ATCC 21833 / DSM 2522 / FERM P-1141 / JCM 9156 / N-4) TaxID=649639 RepID=E6TTI8_EVAC2|nr:acyl-CoA thioesterase/bile acid-CoA:amino acid N-acyltransferase family protein [Evansella cellulosilytica]ADU29624.1 alpha/beta fold family hydrolase [Evansella cellulosilytica DSM 2522]
MKCFLYPDIGRVDEPLQLHMDGLKPNETITLTLKMKYEQVMWTSTTTTAADDNGKLSIGSADGKSNILSELLWKMHPQSKQQHKSLFNEDISQLTLHIDIEAEESQRKEARTITRMFKEDYVHEEQLPDELNINGTYFSPKNKSKLPSIIILGDRYAPMRNDIAALLASHGYGALSLNYNGASQNKTTNVPVEPLNIAIEWLKEHRSTDQQKIILFGMSKGAELALLLASKNRSVRAVIAHSPASHVFQCEGNKNTRSFLLEKGHPLPYVPLTNNLFSRIKGLFMKTNGESESNSLYYKSLQRYENKGRFDAMIAAEKIRGPIMMISGKKDAFWPSTYMAEKIQQRLKENQFPYDVKHICYENAGHFLTLPYTPYFNLQNKKGGGISTENAIAGEEAWLETLSFLKKHFPPAKIPTESFTLQLTK